MAPFITATLPLHSWRIITLHQRRSLLRRRFQSKNGDRPGFGTTVKADAAPGAAASLVTGRVHAIAAQFRRQFQTGGGAGFHAKPAALALFHADDYVPSWWACHTHLVAKVRIRSWCCNHFVCSQYS